MGLKIADSDLVLDDLIWKVYLDVEDDMKMRVPFEPLALCLSEPTNSFLVASPPTVNVPSNVPPQLLLQFWQQYLTQNVATHQCKEKDFELIQAVLESSRRGSRFVTKGKVFAARKPDMDYIVGMPRTSSGWELIDIA